MSDNRVVGQLDFSGKRHIGVMLILLSAFLYSPVGVFSKGVDADSWSIIFWRGAIAVPAGIFYLMLTGKLGSEWCRLQRNAWFCLLVVALQACAVTNHLAATTVIADISRKTSLASGLPSKCLVSFLLEGGDNCIESHLNFHLLSFGSHHSGISNLGFTN